MELSLPLRPRRAAGSRARSGRRSGAGRPHARPLSGAARLALDAVRARRLPVRVAVCAMLSLPLLGGGWLWLRDSSLAAVEHVHIAGVHGAQALQIRRALDAAAERMSTLHLSTGELRAAVARYPQVAALSASASFPHTLSIRVAERTPVAILLGPGVRTAVAADGTVLGGALASASLPTVAVKDSPAPGARLRDASALEAALALGAGPAPLRAHVTRVYEGGEGLTLQMRNGLLVYFGDASQPHAKWLSLARVLASPAAAGALYVDVRLPARPAAGFTRPGSAQASASALTGAQAGSSDPAAAKLAEQLSREVGGVATAGAATTSSGTGEREGAGSAAGAEGGGESAAGQSEASESPSTGTANAEASTSLGGG
jgi:cell division protein FtsQ